MHQDGQGRRDDRSARRTERHVAPRPSAAPMSRGATIMPSAKKTSIVTMARSAPVLICEVIHMPGRLLRKTHPPPTNT